MRWSVSGGLGVSKRMLGPADVVLEENIEDSRGRMKRIRSGSRFDSVVESEGAGASEGGPWASRGRRRGRPPPIWCTRNPGPPPRLNTKPGPLSNMPPPRVGCHFMVPVECIEMVDGGGGIPKGPPNPPPIPPPKNRLNISSGDISSSHIGPCRPEPGVREKPLKGDWGAAELEPNLLSGSPPNLSNLDFLSGSDSIWKALDTTLI